MNSWVSEVIAEPRNMQKTVDESIIDGVMSGLIRQNDTAEERFVPKLISNQPGSTMGDAIREELKGSESFDISVAFVSENALKSMYQAFVDHAKKSGKRNRIITSTKNYFNSPKAFKELMKLQRDANVEVLIWEHGDSGESGGGRLLKINYFIPKGISSPDAWKREELITICMSAVRTSRPLRCRISVNGIFVCLRPVRRS